MTISSLSHVAHAIANGTFCEGGPSGTAPEELKKALRKLCCVRGRSIGPVTKMVCDFRASDRKCRDGHVAEHAKSS